MFRIDTHLTIWRTRSWCSAHLAFKIASWHCLDPLRSCGKVSEGAEGDALHRQHHQEYKQYFGTSEASWFLLSTAEAVDSSISVSDPSLPFEIMEVRGVWEMVGNYHERATL